MRHLKKKKLKLGYDKSRRVLKSMASSLILYEKIETTASKGRIVKAWVEKLITHGKTSDLHHKRMLFAALPKNAARKVFEILGPKYKDRAGGYTRLLHIGLSRDGARLVRIELV